MSVIAENLDTVNRNIEKAVSLLEDKKKVRLVAVSKTKSVEEIQAAYNHGQRVFGENYIQEIVEKAPKLPRDIMWHFIGRIQSNKVRKLCSVKNLFCVETVDRVKIARMFEKELAKIDKVLNVMVQVNTSEEDQKGGAGKGGYLDVVKYILKEGKHLKFIGLMTIGDFFNTNKEYQPDFDCLVKCREKVVKEIGLKKEEIELSMGMSSDYEQAIKWGSTSVRVGSKIFGSRNY